MKNDHKILKRVLKIVAFVVGLGIFAYPIISNIYTDMTQTKAIDEYQKTIKMQTSDEIEESRQKMIEYNNILATGVGNHKISETPIDGIQGADIVVDGLDAEGGEPIGVLKIPSIKLETPIFNGASEKQLQRGVGVLYGTSMPIGGQGAHSVITGHRGLPTAKLFSDLPDVKMGDEFFVEILNEVHAYKVIAVKTINPNEVEQLQIIPEQDLITLLTCTPYMINTHRLIVTGTRIPYDEEAQEDQTVTDTTDNSRCYQWILLILLIIIAILLTLFLRMMGKRNQLRRRLEELEGADELPPDNKDQT